jgi:alpha-glucosidase
MAAGFPCPGRPMPRPMDSARDRQRDRPGSTYEMYRAALATRQARKLGQGDLTWYPGYPDEVVAFTNGSLLVLANTGSSSVPLPAGAKILVSNLGEQDCAATEVPADTTVWAILA